MPATFCHTLSRKQIPDDGHIAGYAGAASSQQDGSGQERLASEATIERIAVIGAHFDMNMLIHVILSRMQKSRACFI
ncbi:hypothetical protein [Gluconobacter morbifer]|uniref:hypothetical protein n=1 Tax=Gluconobacter morbifer TaxID=479935 RepID=UPI0002EB41FB|nr:hypothetical protein [Gluconobacter morbifer]